MKARWRGPALAILVLFSTGLTGLGQDPATAEAGARTGDALIYFYRTSSFTDSFLNPTIYSGPRRLARLEKDQFFVLPVSAGTHYFSWTDTPEDDEQAWVTVSRGELAFF